MRIFATLLKSTNNLERSFKYANIQMVVLLYQYKLTSSLSFMNSFGKILHFLSLIYKGIIYNCSVKFYKLIFSKDLYFWQCKWVRKRTLLRKKTQSDENILSHFWLYFYVVKMLPFSLELINSYLLNSRYYESIIISWWF